MRSETGAEERLTQYSVWQYNTGDLVRAEAQNKDEVNEMFDDSHIQLPAVPIVVVGCIKHSGMIQILGVFTEQHHKERRGRR